MAETLKSLGILSYLPLAPKARLHHNVKVVTDVPMIAGYIFLCTDLMTATELRTREKSIVRVSLQTEEASERTLIHELNVLQKCEALARTRPVFINPQIVAGDKVTVVSGPFKDLETDVVRRDDRHDAIIINLTMLGRHVEIPVSAADLRKIKG